MFFFCNDPVFRNNDTQCSDFPRTKRQYIIDIGPPVPRQLPLDSSQLHLKCLLSSYYSRLDDDDDD